MLSALIQSMVMAWQTQSYNEKRVVPAKLSKESKAGDLRREMLHLSLYVV